MYIQRNISGAGALWMSLNFKFVKNLRVNTDSYGKLYVPFDVLINMCNLIFPYIYVGFVVDRRLSFIPPPPRTSVMHFRSTTVFRILHNIATDLLYLCRKWPYARKNVRKVPYFLADF
jgi:hypothetical protein